MLDDEASALHARAYDFRRWHHDIKARYAETFTRPRWPHVEIFIEVSLHSTCRSRLHKAAVEMTLMPDRRASRIPPQAAIPRHHTPQKNASMIED